MNLHWTVFLSNLPQNLTSCSKMNVKSADIRSISQYTNRGLFYLRTEEKYIYFTSKVLLTEF